MSIDQRSKPNEPSAAASAIATSTPSPDGGTRQVRSFCRFCSALCGIVVTVDRDDQVIEVRGDAEHPISNGYTCPKGRALGAWHHHPNRLDVPLVGRGDDRHATDWDTALGGLAEQIQDIAERHGNDAVGMYMATATSFDAAGGRMGFKLFQSLKSRSRYSAVTIDTPCRPMVSDLLSGNAGLMPCIDHDAIGLTILVGTNPVVSHGHTTSLSDPVNRLRALGSSGRELWVVDPRSTESARLATRHLAPRPGSDYALFAYVIRELLTNGGTDAAYLERHCAPDDVARLTDAVAPFDANRVTAETDLDVADLDELVATIRRFGRVGVMTGTGTTMSPGANSTEWLIWALQIITGSYEQPGGLWFHPGFLRCFDRRTLRPSDAEPIDWPRPPSRPDLPGFYGEYPCAAMADEIESGNLKALIVFGGNPANSFPDTPRMKAALASLEVLAVADVIDTDTTALATHVLPTTGQLERADVPDYVDQYYPVVASQYTPAVVAPGADRKPLWWICGRLGERLGHSLLPQGLTPDTATDDTLLDTFSNRGRQSLDELRAAPSALIAEGPVRGWVHEQVLPDGRWRLAPTVLVADLARMSSELTDTTTDSYPLMLIPRRVMRTLNSQLRDTTAPGGRVERPLVMVHPVDAEARQLRNGDEATVVSVTGSTVGTIKVDESIRPGVVSVPHGFATTTVGNLTTSRSGTDPLTAMVRQSGIAVQITPVRGSSAQERL